MKKMLALLLTAIMLSALIMSAACTPVEEKPDNTPQPTEAGAQTDEPAGPTAEPTEPITEPVADYSESWRERPIPEVFDLRSVDTDGDGEGDRCFVPPVRNQRPFESCWGFAATGAAEISILGSILKHDPDAWKTIILFRSTFVILPPKAEITEAEGSDNSIRLAFADLWSIGVDCYEVEYRKVGSIDWIKEQVGEGAVEHTITGLDGGVSYEVRIRAYAKAMTIVQIEMDQYGEYSDTMTVAVP